LSEERGERHVNRICDLFGASYRIFIAEEIDRDGVLVIGISNG
jgi:hypothetical protein